MQELMRFFQKNNVAFYLFSCFLWWGCQAPPQDVTRGAARQMLPVGEQPAILVGGQPGENLFQWHPVEPALDALKAAGGNFLVCSLSSRFSGNAWPFQQGLDSKFYFDQPQATYFIRLEKFLQATQQRGIVVQLELWDAFDFFKANNGWAMHPFNPKNNVAYDTLSTPLPYRIGFEAGQAPHPFFENPEHPALLPHTSALMRQILDLTFRFDHVVYSVGNEAYLGPKWVEFWQNG